MYIEKFGEVKQFSGSDVAFVAIKDLSKFIEFMEENYSPKHLSLEKNFILSLSSKVLFHNALLHFRERKNFFCGDVGYQIIYNDVAHSILFSSYDSKHKLSYFFAYKENGDGLLIDSREFLLEMADNLKKFRIKRNVIEYAIKNENDFFENLLTFRKGNEKNA